MNKASFFKKGGFSNFYSDPKHPERLFSGLPAAVGTGTCGRARSGMPWGTNPKPFSAQTKHFSEPAAHWEALSLTPGPKEKAHLFT